MNSFDTMIQDLRNNMQAMPSADLQNRIKRSMVIEQNPEIAGEPYFQRRSHRNHKRVLLIAAVAIVVVALSGIALAAVAGIDFGGIYNSFFNNPAADNRIEVSQTAVSDGLEITLLTAFTDGNQAYALVELKDMVGGRLSDSVRVVSDYFKNRSYLVNTGTVVYYESENRALVTLVLSLGETVGVGDIIVFCIDYVLSGIGNIDNDVLSFDIAAHASEKNETVTKDEWLKIADNKTRFSTYPGNGGVQIAEGLLEPDIMLLLPGDMEIKIDGIDWAIVSNAGVVDGKLHLQLKYTESYNWFYNTGGFTLLDDTGRSINSNYKISMGDYEELVFATENVRNLTALSLAVSGERIDNYTLGPWEMSFTIDQEMPKKNLSAFPLDSQYMALLDVTCSPMLTSIRFKTINADLSDYIASTLTTETFAITPSEMTKETAKFESGMLSYIESYGQPFLTLNDGKIIYLEFRGGGYGFYDGKFDYVNVYYDIDKLHSITFCGAEYLFTNAS